MGANSINIEADIDGALAELERMEKSLSRKKINSIQRRNADPMLEDMKQGSPSVRIAKMTAITTRQTKRPRAPRIGIRIGVINNDASEFPKFTAPAMASVLEYGTDERFRSSAKMFGFVIGTASTGSVTGDPWIRPAYDKNEQAFIAKCIKSYERQVNG